MSKIRNLKDLRRMKTHIGYFGGGSPYELLQKGEQLLVFESREAMREFAIKHHLPPLRFEKKMFFEELVEGLAIGAQYGLTKQVCRVFDKLWQQRIGQSPIEAVIYEQDVAFITLKM